jgi:hypothetical protein
MWVGIVGDHIHTATAIEFETRQSQKFGEDIDPRSSMLKTCARHSVVV